MDARSKMSALSFALNHPELIFREPLLPLAEQSAILSTRISRQFNGDWMRPVLLH